MAPLHPWRNWYHCCGNTHGSWLLGDRRGFRTRHHRRHVQGDYRLPPPPGHYDQLLRRSERSLKSPPLLLGEAARMGALQHLRDQLLRRRVELLALGVSRMHFHLLARFVPVGVEPYEHLAAMGIKLTHARQGRDSAYAHDPAPRRLLGMARAATALRLKREGLIPPDLQVWGKRTYCVPVRSRWHQVAVYRYILAHQREGAAVWSGVGNGEDAHA